jgi:hypothetical protein
MLRTSTDEKPVMCPAPMGPIQVSRVETTCPSRTKLMSHVVPPLSNTMASNASPATSPVPTTWRAASGAIEGPELRVWIGAAAAASARIVAPVELTSSTSPARPACRIRSSSPSM